MTEIMCYQCGKHEASIQGLCESCFLDQQPPLKFGDLKIRRCRECGSLFFESWQDRTVEDILRSYTKLQDADYHIKREEWGISVTVVARQNFYAAQTHPLIQETRFRVYIKGSLCENCSKMLSGYFQAILQVRRENHVLNEEERELFMRLVTQSLREEDFISRIKELKEGTDYYFSSIKSARRTAETLKRQLGGRIKESYHVIGSDEQKGTDISRGTILFSLYPYRKGDMIMYRDSIYEVKDASHKLRLENAMDEKVLPWKKVEFEENKKTITILSPSQYELLDCQVIAASPSSILLMRPDSEIIYLEIPKGIKVKTEKKYRILFFQERAYWM